MSLSPRPNLLRAAAQSKALLLAIPAIAAIALLMFLGRWAADTPTPVVAAAEAGTATPAPAPERAKLA